MDRWEHAQFMAKWREDLRRTHYGYRRDPNPPIRLVPRTENEPCWENNTQLREIQNRIQARLCKRLQQWGYLYKEIATMTGYDLDRVDYLLNRVNVKMPLSRFLKPGTAR